MKFSTLQTENISELSTWMDEQAKDDGDGFKKNWASFAKTCVAYANGDNPNSGVSGLGQLYNSSPLIFQQNGAGKRGSDQFYKTNEIAPTIRTLLSFLTRSNPTIEVFSNDDDEITSNAVAKVAKQVSDALYDLDNEQENLKKAVMWALATGTVFGKDFYNPKTGRNDVAILSGFQVSLDYSVADFSLIRWIRENYVAELDWVHKVYSTDDEENLKKGFTGRGKFVKDDGVLGETMQEFENLKGAVPYRGKTKIKMDGRCLVSELFVEPSDDYPEGRYIIKAGSEIVYATPKGGKNPYYLGTGHQDWHPYSFLIYEEYLGRMFGKSLVEQVLPAQKRLDEINGSILKNANTVAKPNIFVLEGQLKRNYMNGEMANIYTYQNIPNGDKPYIAQGVPLPAQFFQEKQSLIDAIVRMVGTNFVMQGQTPSGVSAASAIAQLLENANSQHGTALNRVVRFVQDRLTKKLRILKKFNTEPNKELNQKLRLMAKKSYNTEYKMFVGATDLADETNIKIEPSTMMPKSEVAKNELYQTIIKEGILGPVLQEDSARGEKTRSFLFEKMGLEKIPNELSSEQKKAEWENQRILLGMPVGVSEFDNSGVHLSCHIELLQSPDFLENATDEQKVYLDNHIAEHKEEDARKEEEAKAKAFAEQQAMMEQQILGGGQVPAPVPSGDVIA